MQIFIVFSTNKHRKYLVQQVCSTEKKAIKTIKRLVKLDTVMPSTFTGYFYEEFEVDKLASRLQNFLDRKNK